ncbi:MAG: choice-of-anchor J domain-containing protein [Dysgonamonadaceae bacterium]|jgi:hypothetical protein|nr:choice-of-anchor J domain-containing protein [Dysgonamonadaceae bacterium]
MKRIVFTIIFTGFMLMHGASAQQRSITVGDGPGAARSNVANSPVASVQESFEGNFPPDGWANRGWERVEALSAPSPYNVAPQDGRYMLRYDCELIPDQKVWLTTPCFLTGGENKGFYFWFYRDSYYPGLDEKINIYLSETGDITGLSPVTTIHRSIEFSPVVAARGWYEYRILLPCAGMTSAYVVVEAEGNGSEWGGAIFIDNLSIRNVCMPPENVTAALYQGTSFYNNVAVTWTMPQGNSQAFAGFNLYRNGSLLAGNLNALAYNDVNLGNGTYTYALEAVYTNDCGVSERVQLPEVTVTGLCAGTWNPENLAGTIQAKEWYNVGLTWDDLTEEKLSYTVDAVDGATGGVANFAIAVRFTPDDLSKYNGLPLTKIAIVPNDGTVDYILGVWQGGSGLNPGTEVLRQTVSASSLNIGRSWNEVELTTPVVVDASQELWISLSFNNAATAYPAAFDAGPIAKEGYSNLIYFNGAWTTLFQLNAEAGFNWSLRGIVKMYSGAENVTGFNLYRNQALVNTGGLIAEPAFLDLVPGGGRYSYEVSAVYDNFCESGKSDPFEVEVPASPCDNPWNTPVFEGFESDRFPAWCWSNTGRDESRLWERVKSSNNPTCTAHTGDGMLRYNCYLYMENSSTLLTSPAIATPNDEYMLSFWMHRDSEESWTAYYADRVNVYLSETGDITSLTPVFTMHRSRELDPVVATDGWYEYRVPLNTTSLDEVRIVFEAVSMWGANLYLDDITVYDPLSCVEVSNLTAEQPLEGNVVLSWEAPVAEQIAGYRIERDGQVIVASQTETTFSEKLPPVRYNYCVTTLYNKVGCSESAPVCIEVEVIRQCDPVANVRATQTAQDAIRIDWDAPLAALQRGYSVFRNEVLIGSTMYDTFYQDENLPAGSYRYSIVANYVGKDCTASEPRTSNPVRIEHCIAVNNLRGNIVDRKIVLDWDFTDEPEFTEVLFAEGFENGIPSGWLNLTDDDDFAVWNHQEGGGQTGSYVYSLSYADFEVIQFPVDPNNWLITPPIHLYGTETLEYYISSSVISPQEHYGVYISTTGTGYGDFSLLFEETLTAADTNWRLRTVDLSAYSGTVRLAFRHFDSYAHYTLKLDEVTVRSTWGYPAFEVQRDGQVLATVKGRSYTDATAQTGVDYMYCVVPVYSSCSVDPACIPMIMSSLGDVRANPVTVFPNPAADKVFVSGENMERISIYLLTGQLIEQIPVDKADTVVEVSLSAYKQGLYLFKIETGDGPAIREVIKK